MATFLKFEGDDAETFCDLLSRCYNENNLYLDAQEYKCESCDKAEVRKTKYEQAYIEALFETLGTSGETSFTLLVEDVSKCKRLIGQMARCCFGSESQFDNAGAFLEKLKHRIRLAKAKPQTEGTEE